MSELPQDRQTDELQLLQADIDDETPEVIATFLRMALKNGALDAIAIPLIMKKGRPGVRVELLVSSEHGDRLAALILRETSTIGVRRINVQREALARRVETVKVSGVPVRVKVSLWEGKAIKAKPEFDDCVTVAEEKELPIAQVVTEARAEASKLMKYLNDSPEEHPASAD